MTQDVKRRFPRAAALLLGLVVTCAGCESKGPAEKAGEAVDQCVQNAKDAIDAKGPAEKAGEAVDNALKK